MNNDLEYSIYKDIKKFYESGGDNSKYNDIDCLYYEIETKEIFEIGSEVTYNQKDFYVREYEANNKKEEIVYKYKLCRKEGVWQNIIYNNHLKGATIEGKVIEVKDELVKIHLDIDKNQSKSEAHWFSYAPPSVNIMYSMPLVGEKVRLYFQNNMDENPIIIGCVRNNGDSCTKTSNPNRRYFETEHGNEIAILEDSLKLKNGHKKGISINFDDNIGVHLKSSQKLKLDADKEIIIKTRKRVKINAANKILMIKRNKSHGVSIEGEFYIKGDNVIINGSDRETYSSLVDGSDA